MRKIKRFMASVMSALMLVSMASFSVKAAETETDADIEVIAEEHNEEFVPGGTVLGTSIDNPIKLFNIDTTLGNDNSAWVDSYYPSLYYEITVDEYSAYNFNICSPDHERGVFFHIYYAFACRVYSKDKSTVVATSKVNQEDADRNIGVSFVLEPGVYYVEVSGYGKYDSLEAYCTKQTWGIFESETNTSEETSDILYHDISLAGSVDLEKNTVDWYKFYAKSGTQVQFVIDRMIDMDSAFCFDIIDPSGKVVCSNYRIQGVSHGPYTDNSFDNDVNTFNGVFSSDVDGYWKIKVYGVDKEYARYADYYVTVRYAYNANCGHVDKAPGGTWNGTSYTNPNGQKVINAFFSDGTYTYFLDAYGNAMKDRLTYHPDGVHVIYFDENGHEVFSNFAHVKKAIAGNAVDDYCFFDVHGYMYVDVMTYDVTGKKLYYVNPYGQIERKGWFKFSNTAVWAGTTKKVGTGWGYGQSDGTLMINKWTTNKLGKRVYMQGDGHMK